MYTKQRKQHVESVNKIFMQSKNAGPLGKAKSNESNEITAEFEALTGSWRKLKNKKQMLVRVTLSRGVTITLRCQADLKHPCFC